MDPDANATTTSNKAEEDKAVEGTSTEETGAAPPAATQEEAESKKPAVETEQAAGEAEQSESKSIPVERQQDETEVKQLQQQEEEAAAPSADVQEGSQGQDSKAPESMEVDGDGGDKDSSDQKEAADVKQEAEETEETKKEKQEARDEDDEDEDEDQKDSLVLKDIEPKTEVKEEQQQVVTIKLTKSEHKEDKPKLEPIEEKEKLEQKATVMLARLPEGAVEEAKENMAARAASVSAGDKENVRKDDDDDDVLAESADVGTQTRRPHLRAKGVSAQPDSVSVAVQTDGPVYPPVLPLPCPMWMPVPFGMYTTPKPEPVPVPLPVPVPVFVPTTRNSYRGIRKQIRKIVSKVPANMLEAELLKLAGEITGEKTAGIDYYDSADSDPEDDDDYYDEGANGAAPAQTKPGVSPMDLEKDIRGDRVLPKALPPVTPDPTITPGPNIMHRTGGGDGGAASRPRGGGGGARGGNRGGQKRRYSAARDNRATKIAKQEESPASQAALNMANVQPKERPDAKHHLKFTYGVNAWRHWVVQKNAELEKLRAQGKYMKTFDTDILKLRADELIYTLCMFVKEVKKPNGEEYTPDSVLYLTLGIQEYLFENGRIDNVFTDMYYEPFTTALHEIVKDFKLPVNELGYFVTRIEEEHLWEAKQLGAHSPQVLLNTVIYFNTKYFLLKSVDQHTRLSFSHIMKHWKRSLPNPASRENQAAVPGLEKKTILLRYYPPASKTGRGDDRKCYEQHENPDNPLRCPVKLYEFYLSKCPESTKTRSDLFYLQPERSCVPDSPVWYSSNPLNNHQLDKMLQRLLMVREVQEHMLAEASENVP